MACRLKSYFRAAFPRLPSSLREVGWGSALSVICQILYMERESAFCDGDSVPCALQDPIKRLSFPPLINPGNLGLS